MGFASLILWPLLRYWARKAKPVRSGNSLLPALTKAVRVVWGPYAVPHLIAENEPDLFVAQGFVHAQERLWQMDFSRRFFCGRLAEIFGAKFLPARELPSGFKDATMADLDFFVRLMGIRQTAVSSLALLPDKLQGFLEAYSQGVNRFIETHRNLLPVEFRLLRYEPEPWRPEDCLTIGKGFALLLSTSLLTRLALTALAERLHGQESKLRSLYPSYPSQDPCITRVSAESSKELLCFLNGTFTAAQGSNSWVVASSRSATGKPILCNDTHLRMNLPSVWYLMHLKAHNPEAAADNFTVWGATVPGCPCVYIGHNASIAWGVTAALCDDADLYEEKIHPADLDLYLAAGEWKKMKHREEHIAVRGGAGVRRIIRSTRHGPLLSDFTSWGSSQQAMALKWTGQDPALEFQALYGINRARDWSEFLDSLELHVAPTLNYLYADISGNIGYSLAGKVPLRLRPSLLPLPGWREDFEWQGYIPFAELPRLYNPPEGVIANANNSVADQSYPYYLSALFEPPYRIRRIREVLTAKNLYTLEDMAAIQRDIVSTLAQTTIAILKEDLEQAAVKEPTLAEHVNRLLAWDGSCSEGSDEAALFHVFHQRLMGNILEPDLGSELLRAYAEIFNQCLIPLEQILGDPQSPWFEQSPRAAIIGKSLREAVNVLSREFGAEKKSWGWGRLHALTLRHPLGQNQALAPFFSIGPVPSPGDAVTINMGFFSHANPYDQIVGPTLRMILDSANWGNSKFILVSGQSGHPFSRYYRDQFQLWQTGSFICLDQDPEKMVHRPVLILTPRT
ncbi:MAG: penicillin acylase family protein [Candidatus Binatia bacterium]